MQCEDGQAKNNAILFPVVTVGALIFNRRNELLLVKSKKWNDQYGIPAGKLKLYEPIKCGLQREIKEETGLDVFDVRFLLTQELIHPEGFYLDAHYVSMNYCCRTDSSEVVLNDEAYDYIWIKPEITLEQNLNKPTFDLIQYYSAMSNTDKIVIRDLVVNCIVGIHQVERIREQAVHLTIEITTNTIPSALSDDITSTIDYSEIQREVERLVVESKYQLLETMANDIATLVLTKSGAQSVRVVTKKPEAVINGRYAAVDIFRTRSISCELKAS